MCMLLMKFLLLLFLLTRNREAHGTFFDETAWSQSSPHIIPSIEGPGRGKLQRSSFHLSYSSKPLLCKRAAASSIPRGLNSLRTSFRRRSEERRVGKECRGRGCARAQKIESTNIAECVRKRVK